MEIKLKCADYTKKLNIKETIKNVFDFNIGTVLTEVVGITESKETKAFMLLFNTFKTTNVQLKKELGQDILDKTKDLVVSSTEFDIVFKNYFEQEITITKDFFEDVIKHNPEYLRQSFKVFKANLFELKIDVPENYEYNYYSNYRDNLQKEFQEKNEYYNELVLFFNNPIYDQNKPFDKQLNHYKNIKSFFTNPLQTDIEECKESLKHLYIDPNFKIHKNNADIQNEDYEDYYEDFQSLTVPISIHSFLNEYFLPGNKLDELKANYNMLFLLGQPGQGKTSFCYKLIYDYLENNQGLPVVPIYFIKIRDLTAKDFINDTFSTINRHLKQNISFEEDKCILLLDGLDEAYMAGGLNDSDLKDLYDRLNKTTQQNSNLKIILTSRLNYLKINDPCLDKSLVCQLDVLNDEQISLYVEKFKRFYPNNKFLKKILSQKKYIHIKELLQQAVLIYFIAIADIDIEERDSKANIYDKIFDSLAKRSWDKQRGQLDYIKPKVKENCELYTKYLRAYIRNIAFEIYQSPNLYITLDKLSELNSTKQFIKRCFNEDLLKSQEEIKEINKYLLISFYFQEANNNKTTETAIEFFHNSLWEYLTAEYMWEENKKILLKKEIDDEDEYENISKEAYFELLNKLIGQKQFSYAIRNNLLSIIQNENEDIKKTIFNQSIKIFYKLSEDDFLLEFSKKSNKLTALEKSISIFDLLWNFINISKNNFNYKIYTNSNINRFLFFLSNIAVINYRNIDFEEDSHYATDIIDATIENVNFNNFDNLKYVIENVLNNTVFNCCEFYYCIFRGNEFINTNFMDCTFYEINFFENNSFVNVKFFNVEVPTEDWLEVLHEENIIDELTKSNHIIEKTLEKNYRDNDEIKYYIRYIGG
ncbi:NACHT domain-containing protein [Flavobacterium pectinovorum]|uniref:NACHT domain-containing protein n=1 Tax=Flavobacterium pectinovorum TaxID=29533 RepID=UPI00265E0ADE|nr:NACHT domain-containing protein [Flavobacterium pectinovorum]WKL46110.1 NACHT domain-containing protein [Flavobacterium pectinovorum]